MRQWICLSFLIFPSQFVATGCQSAGRMYQVDSNTRASGPEIAKTPRSEPSGGSGANSLATANAPAKPLGKPVDLETPAEKPTASGGRFSGLLGKFSKPKRVPLPRTDLDVFPDAGEEMTASLPSSDDFSSP